VLYRAVMAGGPQSHYVSVPSAGCGMMEPMIWGQGLVGGSDRHVAGSSMDRNYSKL
jgi:hypothetical protein